MHHTSTHCCESPHLSMKKKHMLNSRFWTNSQTRLNPITAWASPISFSVKWRGIFAIDGESVHYRSSQVSLTVRWYPFLLLDGERRWEKHCYPSHVTQPHPFLLRPLLAFCKVSRTHFPSRAETDTVKDWCFVQEHKPMKQPGLESSFSIGESKQNLEG